MTGTSTVRIPCTLRRAGTRMHRSYIAHLGGELQASGATEAQAKDALGAAVVQAIRRVEEGTAILWGLDGSEFWILLPGVHGWRYEVHRAGAFGANRQGVVVAYGGSREEVLAMMRRHYYQVWIQPIVEGIVGLCTSWRRYVCPQCQAVGTSEGPVYRCPNPACGFVVEGE